LTTRLTADDVIRLLDLKPHPEGGYFRETFRDAPPPYPPPLAGEGRVGARRHDHHTGGGDDDGRHHRQGDDIAEKHEPEDGHLDRLSLDVGDGNDKRALAHGGEHESRGRDLRTRAENRPRPENPSRPRQRRSRRQHDAGQENEHEGKAEQKPHMRRADRAESRGQFAL
jgi:hypothetical protein